jgi:hypothetical protein
MPEEKEDRPLKVCYTCRHWSYTYKGFCARLRQGVGKFWMCQEWTAAAAAPEPRKEEPAASGSVAP